jgi:hypothetical protein
LDKEPAWKELRVGTTKGNGATRAPCQTSDRQHLLMVSAFADGRPRAVAQSAAMYFSNFAYHDRGGRRADQLQKIFAHITQSLCRTSGLKKDRRLTSC